MSQEIKELLMSDIHVDEDFNCRGHIDAIDVTDLVKDIERHGLIQPVTVCIASEAEFAKHGKRYKLLAGFRRQMAHRVMTKETIKAIVNSEPMSDADQQFLNLAENLQRSQLTFAQECRAIKKLYDLGIGEVAVAERTGTTRGWVQVRYMYLKLPVDIQKEVDEGKINQSQVRTIYTVFKKEGNSDELSGLVRKLKGTSNSGRKAVDLKDLTLTTKERVERRKAVTNRAELLAMQEHIRDVHGNGVATRVLAWVTGAISASEMLDDVGGGLSANDWENLIEKNRNA